jgi:alkylation response protein AidB-like acyl-CoA dehydrogenase
MSQTSDLRATARGLRERIEREADACDRALTLTQPIVDAFTRERFFHLMVPKELGGLEADASTLLDVFEELAYADGSVGWTLMANASATSYVAYLDRALAAEMVKGRPESCFAGQFSPFASVKRAPGGFRVTGNFQFGSGCAHATYIGGAGFITDAAGQVEAPTDGIPPYLAFFVPKSGVELRGNWDVLGLRATASFDYHVKEQDVAAGRAFLLFDARPKTGGPIYAMGAAALAGIGHAGWGLGVAARALDEVSGIAQRGKIRMGAAALKDQQVFQRELGANSLALRSVRLLAHDVFGKVVLHLSRGNPITPQLSNEIMATTAYLTDVAMDATRAAYRASGSAGLRNPSRIQRCFRDLFTGGLHLFVDPRSYEGVAQSRLAAPA